LVQVILKERPVPGTASNPESKTLGDKAGGKGATQGMRWSTLARAWHPTRGNILGPVKGNDQEKKSSKNCRYVQWREKKRYGTSAGRGAPGQRKKRPQRRPF